MIGWQELTQWNADSRMYFQMIPNSRRVGSLGLVEASVDYAIRDRHSVGFNCAFMRSVLRLERGAKTQAMPVVTNLMVNDESYAINNSLVLSGYCINLSYRYAF